MNAITLPAFKTLSVLFFSVHRHYRRHHRHLLPQQGSNVQIT